MQTRASIKIVLAISNQVCTSDQSCNVRTGLCETISGDFLSSVTAAPGTSYQLFYGNMGFTEDDESSVDIVVAVLVG